MRYMTRYLGRFFDAKSNVESNSRILIFGASQGGTRVYRDLARRYNIIGFIDNNKQLHGTEFLGLKIYSPDQIHQLNYHRIVIASDYRKEIYEQLTVELNICNEKINIFSFSTTANKEAAISLSQLKNAVFQRLNRFVCDMPNFVSLPLFSFLSKVSERYRPFNIRKITWLDQLETHIVQRFRGEEVGISYGPKIIGKEGKSKPVIIPEVCLFRFKGGQIMANANAVIFGDSNIAIMRVPSFSMNLAQYSSGFIVEHGLRHAMTRECSPVILECGIAIIGAGDTNYYHWVIEVLGKLQFIEELSSDYDDFPILISERACNIGSIRTFLSLFNLNREIIYLNGCTHYQVKELLFINSPNFVVTNLRKGCEPSIEGCFIRDESLAYLRNLVLKAAKTIKAKRMPKRVFLARKGDIRDYNQAEVQALLEKYDFTAVYLEDLNLLQQARLLNQADMVVGPSGAAWTNIIFCQTGVRGLCWVNQKHSKLSCFSNLAYFAGLQLDYLCYQNDSNEVYYDNYSIELKGIETWVASVLNTESGGDLCN